MSNLISTFQERFGDWLTALGQHLQLSLLTLLVAIFLTIPLAVPFHTKIMMLIITYLSVLYCNGFSLEYLGFEAKKGLKDDKIFLHVTEI